MTNTKQILSPFTVAMLKIKGTRLKSRYMQDFGTVIGDGAIFMLKEACYAKLRNKYLPRANDKHTELIQELTLAEIDTTSRYVLNFVSHPENAENIGCILTKDDLDNSTNLGVETYRYVLKQLKNPSFIVRAHVKISGLHQDVFVVFNQDKKAIAWIAPCTTPAREEVTA